MLVDGGGGGGVSPGSPTSSSTVLPKRNINPLGEKALLSPLVSNQQSPVKVIDVVKGSPHERGRGILSYEKGRNLLHTPPLIDVEARLANTPPHVLIRSISSLSQQSIRPRTPDTESENLGGVPAMRKGILLQARDRLFSRWKERFFVLTKDYLACFRRGSTKYSEMGSFIFKINLASVDAVGWEDRRGGPVLSISLPREGKMLLRAKTGLDQWYRDLREATAASRNRRNALRRGSSTTHLNHLSNNLQSSPLFKAGGNLPFSLSDSTPEIVQLCESVCRETSPGMVRNISRPNRFSLMANIDLGSCEGDPNTPPSSVNSSHKFSSSTSSTSGSGGSSSLASSPSLRGSGAWPRPSSPVRAHSNESGPRSRFSLYEAPREPISGVAKTRHSVCVEPRGFHADIASVFRRRQTHANDACRGSRSSLCLQPRNPLLDLIESADASLESHKKESSTAISSPLHKISSPAKSEPDTGVRLSPSVPISSRDVVDTSPSPSSQLRPRAHSTTMAPEKGAFAPRSRTNLALFRHSAIFN